MHTPTGTELANLARRWSDHWDFGWVAGMRTNRGETVIRQLAGWDAVVYDPTSNTARPYSEHELNERWPDLTDAATVGVLWALLCEAAPSFSVSVSGAVWFASVVDDGGGRRHVATAYSRVGALVAAWEAL